MSDKSKKVFCGECECWEQKPNNVNAGTCTRRSAHTSDMAASYWPETPPQASCWDGIKKNPELLVEEDAKE